MPARKKIVPRRSAPKKRTAVISTRVAAATRTFTITNTALAIALACLGTASIAAAGMGSMNACAAESQKKDITENQAAACKKQTLFLTTVSFDPQPIFVVWNYNGSGILLQSNGTPAKKYINKNQAASFGYGNNTVMVTYLGLDGDSRALLKFFIVAPPSAPAPASQTDTDSTVTTADVISPASSTQEVSQTSASINPASDQVTAPLLDTGPVTKVCVDPDTSFDPYLNFYPGKAPVDILQPTSLNIKSAIQIKMNKYNSSKVNTFTDNCSPDDLTKVNEALCIDKNKVGMFAFECPSGTSCNDGACK